MWLDPGLLFLALAVLLGLILLVLLLLRLPGHGDDVAEQQFDRLATESRDGHRPRGLFRRLLWWIGIGR